MFPHNYSEPRLSIHSGLGRYYSRFLIHPVGVGAMQDDRI